LFEITELSVIPTASDVAGACRAICRASLNNGLAIKNIRILEGKKGIYVKYPPSVEFLDKETKKEASNRVLATYVINHCIDGN